jgi:membrane-associated HD superfamily phosphohydrolase
MLQESQRQRALALADDRKQNTNGGKHMTVDLNLDQLELSDEARSAIEQLQAEANELRTQREQDAAELRASKVETRISELKDMGLEAFPGFLKAAREVYLSDDGGTAILLSEEGNTSKTSLTASQIADRFIEALPKNDEGKVNLSEQILSENADVKPPNDAKDELPREEKTKQVEDWLYPNGRGRKSKRGAE